VNPRTPETGLRDGFDRRISYLRLSLTDRCDLRCRYCMAENMKFLGRNDLLTLDELALIAEGFIARGIAKIRLTGGEPLARTGAVDLAARLGRQLGGGGLEELTLTTNGTRLARDASALRDAGIKRINVSLDTLDPERFRYITRWGDLAQTLAGIDAAKAAGLHVKINMVALKGLNDDEFAAMLRWCGARGHDLTRIEEDRSDRYLPLDGVRRALEQDFTLTAIDDRTGGPARYLAVRETGTRLGLITPLTENFCASCNRVRLAADGKLYACLGFDEAVDLKRLYRAGGLDAVDEALDAALRIKPERHRFSIAGPGEAPATRRHMNVTGG
jgi:cyclic pyranopterin phosphate synthase